VPAEADTILKPAEADIILDQVPAEADIILTPAGADIILWLDTYKPAEADIILVGHVLACRGRYNAGEIGGGHDTVSVARRLPQRWKEGVFLCSGASRTERFWPLNLG
jgi:hypothetical protein